MNKIEEIKEYISLLENSSLSVLEIEKEDGTKIHLEKEHPAQQHIAADGEIKLCAGGSCRQHLQREDGVVPFPLRSLLHLPAAHGQGRESALLRQRGKAAAHLQPQRTGSVRPPLEGRRSGGHDHDPVRPDPRRRRPQIVQVAVVGRVEAAAVQQDFHFSRSA